MLQSKVDIPTWRKDLREFVANWDPADEAYLGDAPFEKFVYVEKGFWWDDFLKWSAPLERSWGFRGQGDARWPLNSSIDRVLRISGESLLTRYMFKEDVLVHEPELLFEYQQQAHQYINNTPDLNDLVSWLALMQHHGTPTRLLDWTRSSHVAAYFAMEEPSDLAAIWAVDLLWLDERGNQILQSEGKSPIPHLPVDRAVYLDDFLRKAGSVDQPKMVVRVEPRKADAWMKNQRGFFIAKSWTQPSVSELLMSMMLHPDLIQVPCIRKLEIEGELRFEFLKMLQNVNIHRGSLFPDLDGFSRSLKTRLQIKMDELRWLKEQEATNFDAQLLREAKERGQREQSDNREDE